METRNYPDWDFTRKEWLRYVRKNWTVFRKIINHGNIRSGCAYYPKGVLEWLNKFEEMDKKMKEYYKNA